VGDIITTEKDSQSPLEISVGGVGKFHARPGAFRGKKAVEITAAIPEAAKKPFFLSGEGAEADSDANKLTSS
jgi:flagellar motor switch protein FliM